MPSPIEAAETIAIRHGITPDRRDILQDAHTLVVRLADSLVARIVTDPEGPRGGTEWFARETAIAAHLTKHQAPVIPLHPALPPIAFEQDGFAINFWQFVTILDTTPDPAETGASLHRCHEILGTFPEDLPHLAILHESLALLGSAVLKQAFSKSTLGLLENHLMRSIEVLGDFPSQPIHGDAHLGNLMMTNNGLLWADWEDAFSGPVEWDLASIIWNAWLMDADHATADAILASYRSAGGIIDNSALHHSLVARAAVMSAWYPVLYPDPSPERQAKLSFRLDWLANQPASRV